MMVITKSPWKDSLRFNKYVEVFGKWNCQRLICTKILSIDIFLMLLKTLFLQNAILLQMQL